MSYDCILVALDALPLRQTVFEEALETAQLHHARLKLLHCLYSPTAPLSTSTLSPEGAAFDIGFIPPSPVDFQMTQQMQEAELEKTNHWLQEYAQLAVQQGLSATYEIVVGEPGNQICDLASQWQVNLIVIGRHNRSGLEEFFLGSTSNHVLHHASCSVLVIQATSNS